MGLFEDVPNDITKEEFLRRLRIHLFAQRPEDRELKEKWFERMLEKLLQNEKKRP
jgi:hypothetical protein